MQFIKIEKLDVPSVGIWQVAKERKAQAWGDIQSLRRRVKEESLSGNRQGIRYALLVAEERHKEAKNQERAARMAIEESANRLGFTTYRNRGMGSSRNRPADGKIAPETVGKIVGTPCIF